MQVAMAQHLLVAEYQADYNRRREHLSAFKTKCQGDCPLGPDDDATHLPCQIVSIISNVSIIRCVNSALFYVCSVIHLCSMCNQLFSLKAGQKNCCHRGGDQLVKTKDKIKGNDCQRTCVDTDGSALQPRRVMQTMSI